ncbi:carbohydrate kinase family protein [Marinicella meishanensis]|uniref:carbohydrate kinase family protein n=1 Tax=Marinicella meishanensis TaxID=2873263 RepID=UPI001CBF759D|nr:carbohydrate kinase family protein [Marinicella sp. NBU2979]
MSRALICGSLAFDNIMVFEDEFANHILADQIHKLNISFMVPTLSRVFGGVAGNIAYNLKMIGGNPVPMGVVGGDFDIYAQRLRSLGISLEAIKVKDEFFTPQAYITTDMKNNQITAFHPGAMNCSHENHVKDYDDIDIGIVGPDGRDGMIQHANEFCDSGIPFIFDPGQAMPLFDGDDLKQFIEQATWMAVNDYEYELVHDRTGMDARAIAQHLDALIVTRGEKGSEIYADGTMYHIPVVDAEKVVDPTGCGDAYRAGLLYGLTQGLDYQTTGRIASLLGSIKIATAGTQNHYISKQNFRAKFLAEFGYAF